MLVRGIYREHRRSRRSTPCLAQGCRNQENAVLSHSNLQIFFLQILKYFYICSHREDVPHQHLASLEGGGVRPAAHSVGRAPQRQGNAVACGGWAVSWGGRAAQPQRSWVTPVPNSRDSPKNIQYQETMLKCAGLPSVNGLQPSTESK